MKLYALRSMLMTAVLAVTLLSGGIAPLQAAGHPPLESAPAIAKPISCYWNGVAYPLGSKRPALYGAYWQCQLVARVDYTGPAWVFHSS